MPMSCSPHHETLSTLKSVLFRCFFVGLILTLILGLIVIGGWNQWMPVVQQWFPNATPNLLTAIVLDFFTTIRFYLLYVLLVPALGIQWFMCTGSKGHKHHHHEHHHEGHDHHHHHGEGCHHHHHGHDEHHHHHHEGHGG